MKVYKIIGILFVLGAIGVFVPYTMLTISFGYPDILREEPAKVLLAFNKGGASLIFTWLGFALMGFPLLAAYAMLGKKLETAHTSAVWLTTVGIISGVVQIVGLLRWVFVVPVLASDFINSHDPAVQTAIITSFKVIHQFGGVLLGEHLGQLFTIIWTVGISVLLLKSGIISKWLAWLAWVASAIYLLAQAELFATVIPGFPVWDAAGLAGSTLWLAWLTVTGISLIRIKKS